MENNISGVLERLTQYWHTRMGGGLAMVVESQETIRSINRKRLPKEARSALEKGQRLEAFEVRKATWWVTRTAMNLPKRVQLVAWASKGEPELQEILLQGWTDALAYAFHEHALVDRLTTSLAGTWDRLTFFYEFSHIASQAPDLPEMLPAIVDLLAKVVPVDNVFLSIREGEKWRSVTSSKQKLADPEVLLSLVKETGKPMGLGELQDELKKVKSPLVDCGDLLVASLPVGEELVGIIGFTDARPSRFSANDVQLLASAAERVCALIESVYARAAREEQRRTEHELEIAASIQASLLPEQMPEIPKIELATLLEPTRHVGGDIYDVAESIHDEPLVMLADVAGKGAPAAILTAVVHAIFRGQAPYCENSSELMQRMSRLLFQDLDKAETFVTAIILRPRQDPFGFEYASAGHVDAILWRYAERRTEFLPATGIPLGIEPESEYPAENVTMDPGDMLLIYSDGVTEAEDPTGKVLGLQGLSDIIHAIHPAKAAQQIQALREGLEVHREGLPSRDDVALLLMRAEQTAEPPRQIIPFVIPADLDAVQRVVGLIRNLNLDLANTDAARNRTILDDFALAVSEILSNQVRHAFEGRRGRIQGRFTIESERIVADLFDHGKPYQAKRKLKEIAVDEIPPETGYGLLLAEGLLDACEYQRLESSRNYWQLIKSFAGDDTYEH